MKAYVFPGQGAQYPGMGNDLYDTYQQARTLFQQANELLGFSITDVMFQGTEDDLKQTRVTQPALFLHSVILAKVMGDSFQPEMVAGHSLGEFSALVASGAMSFEDGLQLVAKRATAMQKACNLEPSTMAAVLGMDDEPIEQVCNEIEDVVVPANYNSKGQVVISGSEPGVRKAMEKLSEMGAKRVVPLKVSGAFHSPLMEPARKELAEAIEATPIQAPVCPIYQNATARPSTDPQTIKQNLIDQLTAPVLWTQTVENMIADGASAFTEVGAGKVLQGLIKKVNRRIPTESAAV